MRFLLVGLLLLVCSSAGLAESSLKAGELAPVFTLQDLNLESFRGRKVILHFWAPSCFVCPGEVKQLDRLQNKFGNNNTQILTVVSFDNSKKSLTSIQRMNLSVPVVNDVEDSVANLYEVKSLPVTLLIDEQGKLVEIDDPENPSKKSFKLVGQRDWGSQSAVDSLRKSGFIK